MMIPYNICNMTQVCLSHKSSRHTSHLFRINKTTEPATHIRHNEINSSIMKTRSKYTEKRQVFICFFPKSYTSKSPKPLKIILFKFRKY